MLHDTKLAEIKDYLSSGKLADEFEFSAESRRHEILEYLESIMELGELADATATSVIFKGSPLLQMTGLGEGAKSS